SSMWLGNEESNKDVLHIMQQLLEHQRDFDFIDENALSSHLILENGSLKNKSEQYYRAVIIPPVSSISKTALDRLQSYAASGGQVIFLGHEPSLIVDKTFLSASAPEDLSWAIKEFSGELTPRVMEALPQPDVQLDRFCPYVKVTHRRLRDADLYFFFNESTENQLIDVSLAGSGQARVWDAMTGKIEAISSTSLDNGLVRLNLKLEPYHTKFIIIGKYRDKIPADRNSNENISTFSIVARDSLTGELGVAVASRFFAVGSVVPWAKAGAGAVATQSYANTTFGWRGLELLEKGATPDEIVKILLRNDTEPEKRQFGIVSSTGESASYTGKLCASWAGGRNGPDYAIQGNILAGKAVVTAMESAFLGTKGTLAERLYASLLAGEENGGDSRGKQSAALLVVKENAGYGGFTDRAIDIRVDDHTEPFKELGRLLKFAQMNYSWNEGWTLFTKKNYSEALVYMERTMSLAPDNPEVLYDLAVVRLAAGKKEASLEALKKALILNPKLKKQAIGDNDLKDLSNENEFQNLIK
ncbi:MAG: DUF1028 domain-containing protein, partial [Bacteroidales bacterium]